MPRRRKSLFGRGSVAGFAMAATLALMAPPAFAAPAEASGNYNGGVYENTHVGVPFQSSPPCAMYSNWRSVGTLPGSAIRPGNHIQAEDDAGTSTYRGPMNVVMQMTNPAQQWREGPDGTHTDNCAPGTETIPGFHANFAGRNLGNSAVCAPDPNSSGNYKRDYFAIELNFFNYRCAVEENFVTRIDNDVDINVKMEIIRVTVDGVTQGACDRPIAPSSCTAEGRGVTFSSADD